MVLEITLMAKNRLHPWMYITIYTIGAIFPLWLFPTDEVVSLKTLTWLFAGIEWAVCLGCIVHGIFVARWLAREKRSNRQIEEDALLAEQLYQDDEREAREGELIDIVQAIEAAAQGEPTQDEAAHEEHTQEEAATEEDLIAVDQEDEQAAPGSPNMTNDEER